MDAPIKVTAAVRPDKKSGGAVSPVIIKTLLLTCCCTGSLFTFLTCVDTGVSFVRTAVLTAVFCAGYTVLFSLKGKVFRFIFYPFTALLLGLTYFYRDNICAGAVNTLNIYLARVRQVYREKPFAEILEPERAAADTGIFFGFAVLIMCAFGAYCAVRRSSAAGVFAATCWPVITALMFGLEPNLAAFFGAAACWAAMFAVESSSMGPDLRLGKYSSQCGLFTGILAVLCAAAVIFCTGRFGYERPAALNDMYDRAVEYVRGGGVTRTIDEIVTKVYRNAAPSGAINHGKLGEYDEITFDGRTVLEVTMPKSDRTVYLRGFIGSVYTGGSWDELPDSALRELEEMTSSFENQGLDPLLLDGYNLKYAGADMPEYSFSVKNISAGDDYLYMPYGLVPESVSRYEIKGSAFAGGTSRCMGKIYDPDGYYGYQNLLRKRWSVPAALSADEAVYRQFVYENYMDIPESFSSEEIFGKSYIEYITAELEITGKSTLDEMTVMSRKLYYIKKWLRDNCEYSLSTEKLGPGEDFVQNFLKERKGSCSHFATTAVLMCRCAGIPARYVEGYVVKPADFPEETAAGSSATAEIADTRGHAWAEIYLDGYGWYPMEFTPGYGNVRTALPTETAQPVTEPVTEIVTEPAPEPAYDGEDVSVPGTAPSGYVPETTSIIGEQSAPAATTAPPETEPEPESTGSEPDADIGFTIFGIGGERTAASTYDLSWLVILIIVLAAVPAALVLRRNIIIANRRRKPLRAGAMAEYRRFEKLLRIMDVPERGDMGYGEYTAALAERSEYFSGGEAEEIIGLALKASFGGEALTGRDAEELRFAVNSLAKRFFTAQSRWGRLRMKYLHCVI